MRWYGLREEDICEMYFNEVLDFAQGVMVFEGLESSRAPAPMTDKAGAEQYNRNVKKQLRSVWDMMFPRLEIKKDSEYLKKLEDFKRRRGQRQQIAERFRRD